MRHNKRENARELRLTFFQKHRAVCFALNVSAEFMELGNNRGIDAVNHLTRKR